MAQFTDAYMRHSVSMRKPALKLLRSTLLQYRFPGLNWSTATFKWVGPSQPEVFTKSGPVSTICKHDGTPAAPNTLTFCLLVTQCRAISLHRFRQWLGAELAPSHYINRSWRIINMEWISMKFKSKHHYFHWSKCIWKYRLPRKDAMFV